MVLDTGVLLELAVDSPPSRSVKDNVVEGKLQPMTGELNVAELRYVLCRKAGLESAARSVGHLRRSSQVRILPASEFLEAAAEIKSARRLSQVDCVTAAIGEALNVPVLFARREKELGLEMKKSPFKTDLIFLDEL